jgi:hypothetical protein
MTTGVLELWVASMCASVAIAATKDFNRYLAFALGFLLGPIGVIIVIIEPTGVKARPPSDNDPGAEA